MTVMKNLNIEIYKKKRKRMKIKRRILLLSFFTALFITSVYCGGRYLVDKPILNSDDGQVYAKLPDSIDSGYSGENNEDSKSADNKGDDQRDGNKENTQRDQEQQKSKVAYLTFDDGPTPSITPRILDILKEYDIKATFFVIGNLAERNPGIILKAADEGHVIANHSYTHIYKDIYSSTEKFMSDLMKADEVIKKIIPGYDVRIMRFPGGSFGADREKFRQAVAEAGYRYIDWNALNGDAEANNVSVEKQLENIKKTSNGKNNLIILMHDAPGKETTVEALPSIIEYLVSQGYTFEVLQ
jgi:peptidoglycan-N-acetylglucosamine deacetylase